MVYHRRGLFYIAILSESELLVELSDIISNSNNDTLVIVLVLTLKQVMAVIMHI